MSLQPTEEFTDSLGCYLLVTPRGRGDSLALWRSVTHHCTMPGAGRVVYLQGDPFFSGLVGDMMKSCDVGVKVEEEIKADSDGLIIVPGPHERREDLPRIVSFMIGGILSRFNDRPYPPPTSICGNTILFLLTYPHWNGYAHIYEFLKYSLSMDWSKLHNTIELSNALNLAADTFVGVTPIEEEFQLSEYKEDFLPVDDRSAREKTRDEAMRQYNLSRRHTNPHVESYVFADTSIPSCAGAAQAFPLEAISQVMENVRALNKIRPRDVEPLPDYVDVIKEIRTHRWKMWAAEKHAKDPEDRVYQPVSFAWSEEEEIDLLSKSGRCTPETYHDLMTRCHYGLSFLQSDTVYEEWMAAKQRLWRFGDAFCLKDFSMFWLDGDRLPPTDTQQGVFEYIHKKDDKGAAWLKIELEGLSLPSHRSLSDVFKGTDKGKRLHRLIIAKDGKFHLAKNLTLVDSPPYEDR